MVSNRVNHGREAKVPASGHAASRRRSRTRSRPRWSPTNIHYAHNPERLEVSESDPLALQRWFASRLPFDPQLPQIPGARVVGGRLCTLRGNRLALAFFDKDGESLSIFVGDADTLTPDADRAWSVADSEHRCSDAMSGYRVCYDRRGRVVTAVVGPTRITPPA